MSSKRRGRAPAGAGSFQAGPGTVVSLAYELFDAEGELVEASEENATVDVLLGYGDAAPVIEAALDGLGVGESREVLVEPDDAFGSRDPDALIYVDRAELPADVALGDELDAERENGGTVALKVVELSDETAVLDTNHPLSGQRVRLRLRVVAVRLASDEEILAASARLLEEGPPATEALLPAERLLRRRTAESPGDGDHPPRKRPS
jgi:FKBP-type peptidyl-prolyl cis-trans isomerase SlyD